MSFLSILKTIAGVEHAVTPLISVIPGAGTIAVGVDAVVQRVMSSVVAVEAYSPADGQGSLKLPTVIADFDAGLELTQQVLAARGEKLVYDAKARDEAINAQVAAFNAFAKLKASFKIEKA